MKFTQKLSGWILIACAALLIVGGGGRVHAAGIPPLINYQGKLTNAAGTPVANGTYAVVFTIYDVPTGGTALWSESWPTLQTVGGEFSVMLGAATTIPAAFFSEQPTTYLGIKAGSDVEMSPRQRIGAVAYAFHAGNSQGGGIPTGGIIMWSGTVAQIPAGWALCNGANGTPDLRDRFIAGGGGSFPVTGGGLGHRHAIPAESLSTSTAPNHVHHIDVPITTCIGDCVDGAADGSKSVGSDSHGHQLTADTQGAGSHTHTLTPNPHSHGGQSGVGATGEPTVTDHLPRFYVLAFIMKL